MRVRLICKLGECLDGVDVSGYAAGDVIDVTPREAGMLIAEGWAESATEHDELRPAVMVDRGKPALRTTARLRELRKEMETKILGEQEHRRAEDAIREDLHDSRAIIVHKHAASE